MKKTYFLPLILGFYILVMLAGLYLYQQYRHATTENYIDTLRSGVRLLIRNHETTTMSLARNIATDKRLIRIMQNAEYDHLYNSHFFAVAKNYTDFSNLGIHISDQHGINRYFSWTHKALGLDARKWRKDLKLLYQAPKEMHSISVGKFDITFKGIVPVHDANGTFLGIVETITHFNPISDILEKDRIHSAVIIDKRFNAQLQFPFSKHFIDGYHISTLRLNPTIKRLLEEKGVESFIHITGYRYIRRPGEWVDGCYVFTVPIQDIEGKTLGYFVVFAVDQHHLMILQLLSIMIMLLIGAAFGILLWAAYRYKKQYDQLLSDLSDQVKEKTDQYLHAYYHDALTGSYNKSKFQKDVPDHHGEWAVMYDIRNFSKINEMYDFSAGDALLIQQSQRVNTVIKSDLYRINADAFVFFSSDPVHDIQAIRKKCKEHPLTDIIEHITLQPNCAFAINHIEKDHSILQELSIAMKHAKQESHREYCEYQPYIKDADYLHVNALLNDALSEAHEAQIVPYFQAIVVSTTRQIVRYEALARIQYGSEIIMPHRFIPVAEASGLQHTFTRQMLKESVRIFAQNVRDETIGLSVNLFEDDLHAENLDTFLIELCEGYGISPERMTLEILETASAASAKGSEAVIHALKTAGFQIAIDDFGVEYSNFERISVLDIDLIKIDGKYIKDIHNNPKDYIIAKTISNFAHSLGIKVVAEYVHSKEVEEKVREIGIDLMQGYYFHEPSPEIDLTLN